MEHTWPAEFTARMQTLLGEDFAAFVQAYDAPLRRGLRVNTLKCDVTAFPTLFGGELMPLPFCAEGFWLASPDGDSHRAGADPLHHAGAYYMQEPSAMSAVTVLNPQPGERVLDLCAAPGGKTTQIAAALQGTGLLWANEYVKARAQVLAQNVERCGVRNAVVSNADAATLARGLAGWFDAVLVDAPCSGEGMFRKEPAALEQWSMDNIRLCARRQAEILDTAAEMVAAGGRLVYSTCTFAPEENERQIARFLQSHPDFTLADIAALPVSFGRSGYDAARLAPFAGQPIDSAIPLKYTRRILPQDGGEGHFIALLHRVKSGSSAAGTYPYKAKDANAAAMAALFADCFAMSHDLPYGIPQTMGDTVRLLPAGLPALQGLGVLTAGVTAAEVCKNRLEPAHALFMAARNAGECRSVLDLPRDDPRLSAFLRGEAVEAPDCTGWTAVAVGGVVTGFGKASGGVLKNRYPKGLRLRQGG